MKIVTLAVTFPAACAIAAGMKSMRRLLRDRVLGGAFAAIVAYLLVFQALVTATAHAALATGAGDPLAVMCLPGSDASQTSPSSPSHSPECPCTTLCQSASAAPPPDIGPGVHCTVPETIVVAWAGETGLRPAFVRHLAAEARAPPRRST